MMGTESFRGASNFPALLGWLAGPTASGKSEVGLILARRFACAILSVDSRQIYRRLNAGTAKPSPDEQRRAPHLLLDQLEPTESCSAGRFRDLAGAALEQIEARKLQALAVGGAGLYWEALVRGLHPLPKASAEVRARHASILREEGVEGLHRRLRAIDPETAGRLSPGDAQRISRALEVYEQSGRRLSEWLRTPRAAEAHLPVVVLRRRREDLYRRIEERCHQMLKGGLLEEIGRLLDQGVPADAPGLRTVGYREFLPHLLATRPLEVCIRDFITHSRRYAKRQETWLRGRIHDAVEVWVDPNEPPESVAERAAPTLAERVRGPNPA